MGKSAAFTRFLNVASRERKNRLKSSSSVSLKSGSAAALMFTMSRPLERMELVVYRFRPDRGIAA